MAFDRKLQIFISSTFTDLKEERQAAVEAILSAGHIPAGMELFAAGDKSQMDAIRQWIDESDVYMLIAGGRYGSVDKDSSKSYTQLEYEYAIDTGKRFFAVVLTDSAIDVKVRILGKSALEQDHPDKLKAFREVVTSKICKMVDDRKDIKLAVHETINKFLRDYEFDGWVSGKQIARLSTLTDDVARLTRDNAELRAQLKLHEKAVSATREKKQPEEDWSALARLLANDSLTYKENDKPRSTQSVLEWFIATQSAFVSGISNTIHMDTFQNFLFFQVGPHLTIHGLTEDQKVAGVKWRTLRTTKKGNDFLVFIKKTLSANKAPKNVEPVEPKKGKLPAQP